MPEMSDHADADADAHHQAYHEDEDRGKFDDKADMGFTVGGGHMVSQPAVLFPTVTPIIMMMMMMVMVVMLDDCEGGDDYPEDDGDDDETGD